MFEVRGRVSYGFVRFRLLAIPFLSLPHFPKFISLSLPVWSVVAARFTDMAPRLVVVAGESVGKVEPIVPSSAPFLLHVFCFQFYWPGGQQTAGEREMRTTSSAPRHVVYECVSRRA